MEINKKVKIKTYLLDKKRISAQRIKLNNIV